MPSPSLAPPCPLSWAGRTLTRVGPISGGRASGLQRALRGRAARPVGPDAQLPDDRTGEGALHARPPHRSEALPPRRELCPHGTTRAQPRSHPVQAERQACEEGRLPAVGTGSRRWPAERTARAAHCQSRRDAAAKCAGRPKHRKSRSQVVQATGRRVKKGVYRLSARAASGGITAPLERRTFRVR